MVAKITLLMVAKTNHDFEPIFATIPKKRAQLELVEFTVNCACLKLFMPMLEEAAV